MNKRVLIINNGDSGSTGNLSIVLNNYLNSRGFYSSFVYAFGKKEIDNGIKLSNRFFQIIASIKTRLGFNRYKSSFVATRRLLKLISKEKPSVIVIECLNDYSFNIVKLFRYLKENHIPTIIIGHALFYSTGNCGYPQNGCQQYLTQCQKCPNRYFSTKSYFRKPSKNWFDMYKAFEKSDFTIVGVSPYVTEITKSSPITKNCEALTVINGIDTSIFDFKKAKPKEKVHILYVCSDSSGNEKGFGSFIEIAKRTTDKNILFQFVGSYDGALPANVQSIGYVKDKYELARLYNAADLTILTSKNETFSLPVAESLCCGTPVAFFKCGGTETIAIPKYSAIFGKNDINSFVKYIESKTYLNFNKNTISSEAKEIFDINKYLNRLEELIVGKIK